MLANQEVWSISDQPEVQEETHSNENQGDAGILNIWSFKYVIIVSVQVFLFILLQLLLF